MKTVPVAICIIAYNEEKNIGACLESVLGRAAQVVVLNASSTDDTKKVVQSFKGVTYVEHPNEKNLNVNKMRSFEAVDQPWTFYLDADERFTPELWEEVAAAVEDKAYNGYKVGRKNMYFGTWLRYGGQYPELQPRLFRTGKGTFAMQHVHEYLQIEGSVGTLSQPFIHLAYSTMEQYFRKFNQYSDFQAAKWAKEGVIWNAKNNLKFGLIRPFGRFCQKYIVMAGFLDGFLGFVVAFFQGAGELAAYLRVRDHQQ